MPDELRDPVHGPPSRQDRLAAKLRENLRRRKTQARSLADGGLTDGGLADDSGTLPKPPQKS